MVNSSHSDSPAPAADTELWLLIASLGHHKGRKRWDTVPEDIRCLLDQGADPDRGREAPLTTAVRLGHTAIVELLLTYGADVHGGCVYGTPLAIVDDNQPMRRLLIRHGAQETIFTAISEGDEIKTGLYLRESPDLVHLKDEGGMTPLFYAAEKHHIPIMSILLSAGADPNAVAEAHQDISPIHCVCQGGGDHGGEAVALLADHGADLNATDKGGVTALHMAVRDRNADAVQALLTCGAHPDLEDKGRKSTPLRRAVANTGRSGTGGKTDAAIEIVKLLMAHGADPNHVNRSGKRLRESTRNPQIRALLDKGP